MAVGFVVLAVTVTAVLAWAVSRLILFLLDIRSKKQALSKFPSKAPAHWLMGNIPQMGSPEGYLAFCHDLMLAHGRAVPIWFGPSPVLIVCHPDTIKQTIKNTEAKPMSGLNKGYSMVKPWIGEGLLIASGKKWERNRKLLTPAFHFDILRPYVKVYQEAAAKCAEHFNRLIGDADGESVEISEPLGLCTLDIMLTCALSFKTDLQEKGHPYAKTVSRLMELVMCRSMNPLYLIDFVWQLSGPGREFKHLCDYVHQVSGNVIRARQDSLTKDPSSVKKQHLDFLDILLTAKDEHGVGLTFQEIRDEVDTFLFEGHDTTKAALSWCLYCLAKYPEEQKRVWQEVSRVFGDRNELEWEDIQTLQYTSLFVREVMRMYSPGPVISRITTRPVTIDGVELPAGIQIEVHMYLMHHNPLIWTDPETFNPRRFSVENFADHDPYTYVPFSAGQRNCIGQVFAVNEIKTVLVSLMKRFQFGFDADHEKNIVLQPMGTLKSKHGINVKIVPRKSA